MKNSKQSGVTSIMVLLIMFVAMTVMLSLASSSMATLKRSKNERRTMLAARVAESTLEYQIGLSYEQAKLNKGLFEYTFASHSSFADSLTPGSKARVEIQPFDGGTRAWATGYAIYESKRKSIRTLISSRDVAIWNNAVFAGTGAAGQAINGNVNIRGSLHILGEGEPFSDLNGNGQWDDAELYSDDNRNGVWDPGEPFVDSNNDGVWNSAEPFNDTNWNGSYDPPIATTEFSGAFGGGAMIGNNYSGMPLELESMIFAAPIHNGKEDLETEIRVKHGIIALSGSAVVGQDFNPDGGTSKGSIYGSFVSDNYGGNGGASSVTSDNGTSHGYDIAHLGIKFPLLKGIGAQPYVDQDGVSWSTHELYLDNNSLTIPINAIGKNDPAFYYADAEGNRIAWIPKDEVSPIDGSVSDDNRLHIDGVIKIDGDLTFEKSLGELRYSGVGTVYATGDINISADLLPADGLLFPTDTSFGLIAERNMNLATGNGDAQLMMVGAFFAQGTVTSAKQNEIAGTFVANFFDMGKNVPSIYQVPTLVENLPPAMPGSQDYYTLKVRSWRDRKGNFSGIFGVIE